MQKYKLYCVGESGNCYKVALMLELCGLAWEPIFVDYFGGETRNSAWREGINEMGEVPMLDTGTEHLTQSGAILTWLARRTGRFGGRDEAQQIKILH